MREDLAGHIATTADLLGIRIPRSPDPAYHQDPAPIGAIEAAADIGPASEARAAPVLNVHVEIGDASGPDERDHLPDQGIRI